jgi:hypothetical protein
MAIATVSETVGGEMTVGEGRRAADGKPQWGWRAASKQRTAKGDKLPATASNQQLTVNSMR